MSVAESQPRLEEVLTLAEAAAYLRVPEDALLKLADADAVPAQKIGDEWRFLRKGLNDWLRSGGRRDSWPFAPDWLMASRFAEELLVILERRLLHKLKVEASSKPGSKQAVLQHFGVFEADADLEGRLADARARRESGG
jgi:excisionase family DNA binding protein